MALFTQTRNNLQTKLNFTCLILGFIECFCFAGVIFGWFNLRTILEREHYFGACESVDVSPVVRNLSIQRNASESNENGAVAHAKSLAHPSVRDDCSSDSNAMYTLVFTISTSVLNYSSLFTGLFLDMFGTLVCKVVATLMFTGGLILLAISTKDSSWLVFVGFSFLLPIGGYWHLISNVQIGNLFGKWQGTVITLFSGLFDSSSFVLRVFMELYDLGVGMSTLFFSYACLSSILLLNAVFFLPRTHIPYPLPRDWNRHYKPPPPQSSVTSQANEVKGETEKKNESAALDEKPEKDGIESKEEIHIHQAQENEEEAKCNDGSDNLAFTAQGKKEAEDGKGPAATFDDVTDSTAINGKGHKAQVVTSGGDESFWADYVFTRKFLLHVVFVSVNQLKIYIFLSIINDFLDSFNLTEEKMDQMFRVFGISQLTGMVWAPIVGLIVDRNKKGNQSAVDTLSDFALPLLITCVLGSVCSLLLLVPNEANVQFLSFIFQVVLRAFTYGLAFSFIGCNFPSHHMGKLIGILMATAATFSLLQYPLIQSAHVFFEKDFFWMHVLLLLLGVLPFAHPLNIWHETRTVRRQMRPSLLKDMQLTNAENYGENNQSSV